MHLTHALAIGAGGYIAGLLNTAAGSGGLVSLLTVMATGVPPHAATLANQVATPASFWPARRRALAAHKDGGAITAMSVGTLIGSVGLVLVPPHLFGSVAPVVILIAALLLGLQPALPAIATWARRRHIAYLHKRHPDAAAEPIPGASEQPTPRQWWLLPFTLFVCGLYAGLVGAGVGTLTVAALSYCLGGRLIDAARMRNVVCFSAACVAAFTVTAAMLLRGSPLNVPVILVLAIAMFFGGRHGVQLVEVIGPYEFWLRGLIVFSSIIVSIVMMT